MKKWLVLCILLTSHVGLWGQTSEAMIVTRISGVGPAWTGECAANVVDNTSATRQNFYHSLYLTGTGSWSASLTWSDTSCTSGPFYAYDSTATITQASNPPIAFANDPQPTPHRYIKITITGSATAIYTAQKSLYLSPAVGSGVSGIMSLNGLTAATQTFATGTTGTDFNIVSATSTHTFNFPNASATKRGLLSSADWSTFNGKQAALGFTAENVANKDTTVTLGTSDTKYPSQKAVKTYVDTGLALKAPINNPTFTGTVTGTFSGNITGNVTGNVTGNATGNAGTVTNGVYTTGSYADPAWITSLAKAKVGLGSVENTALSTWAGTANVTTLGTITTGTWTGTKIGLAYGGTNATSGWTASKCVHVNAAGTALEVTSYDCGVLASSALGDVTVTTINKLTLTQPATGSTLTIANGKTLTVSNTMTLAATESAVLTFQGTDTYMGRATTDTLTNKTFNTGGTGNVFQIAGTSITSISGNAAKLGSVSGALTSGYCLKADASGNIVSDTGACLIGVVSGASGGTGVANTGKTITLGGNLTTSGAYPVTFTLTGSTTVTLPTSGTLVNSAVATLSSLASIGTITTGVWNGTAVTVPYGGTGAATLTAHGVLVGNGTGAVAATSAGTSGQCLISNGASADPTFQTCTAGVTASGSSCTITAIVAGNITGASCI